MEAVSIYCVSDFYDVLSTSLWETWSFARWLFNSSKIKSLPHKLPLDHAAGKDGIYAKHILYDDTTVCDYLSSMFNT